MSSWIAAGAVALIEASMGICCRYRPHGIRRPIDAAWKRADELPVGEGSMRRMRRTGRWTQLTLWRGPWPVPWARHAPATWPAHARGTFQPPEMPPMTARTVACPVRRPRPCRPRLCRRRPDRRRSARWRMAATAPLRTAAPLENGAPGNLLGGLGSGLAYAGCDTFLGAARSRPERDQLRRGWSTTPPRTSTASRPCA